LISITFFSPPLVGGDLGEGDLDFSPSPFPLPSRERVFIF